MAGAGFSNFAVDVQKTIVDAIQNRMPLRINSILIVNYGFGIGVKMMIVIRIIIIIIGILIMIMIMMIIIIVMIRIINILDPLCSAD